MKMKDPIYNIYYLTPDGLRYDLVTSNSIVQRHESMGMPSFRFIEDAGPNQHGTTIRDWRANTRTITLEIYNQECLGRWVSGEELIDHIRPNRSSVNDNGWLRVIVGGYLLREIPAWILRGPEGNFDYAGSLNHRQLQDVIQFYCNDPFWRDVQQTEVNAVATVEESCLPDCLPLCLGDNNITATINIVYNGTWEGDTIDIVLTGPMSIPIIENVTSGKQIKLNYTLSIGEIVTISIRQNSVNVTNNSGTNLLGVVDNISDLVDFRLVTRGDLTATGTNVIEISASGAIAGTSQISLSYYTRYMSVWG